MNKEKQKLVPVVRFPEFENDKPWHASTFEKVTKINQGLQIPISKRFTEKVENSYFYITNEFLKPKSQNRYYIQNPTKSVLCNEDDVLMTRTGNTGQVVTNVSGAFHNNFFKIKFDTEKLNKDFLVYFLKLPATQEIILNYAGASTIPDLNHSDFYRIVISIPSFKEQQKIANCLSSLDNLITAETEKLENLKDHKKGLLQQLFPANGETKPQFRFPEFKNDGAWKETTLNKITDSIFDGTHQTPKYTEKGIPFFSVENIVSGKKNKFISREDYLYETRNNKPEFGDVLITRIGNIGFSKVIDWDYEFSVYVTLAVIKKSDFFIPKYLNGYLQSSRYQQVIRSKSLLNAAPIKINMDELRKTEILLPPTKNEQQKIANCLSSADDLIQAQKIKIKALKKHKKGLMQQLFPNVNEVAV